MNEMDKKVVDATYRSVIGKQVNQLRRQGKLPAVLYGHKFETTPILLDRHTASRTLHGVSQSTLITINLEGNEHSVLVREIQRDFIRGDLLHVDFQVVSMTEKIKVTVPIVLEGVSPAVTDYNGVVISGITELDVEAFPQDLPEHIVVDISDLNHIGDSIHVRDLVIPINIAVSTDKDEMVVIITAGAGEEPEVMAEAEPGVAEPEVIERGKREEEDEG
jgi:large subunit ribosomal protein L25